jgi:hypothetical protein
MAAVAGVELASHARRYADIIGLHRYRAAWGARSHAGITQSHAYDVEWAHAGAGEHGWLIDRTAAKGMGGRRHLWGHGQEFLAAPTSEVASDLPARRRLRPRAGHQRIRAGDRRTISAAAIGTDARRWRAASAGTTGGPPSRPHAAATDNSTLTQADNRRPIHQRATEPRSSILYMTSAE